MIEVDSVSQANRADPVCGTCRRKSRKCDRAKPQCRRCLSKGLVCEGYEARFKIYDANTSTKKRKSKDAQIQISSTSLSSIDSPAALQSEIVAVRDLSFSANTPTAIAVERRTSVQSPTLLSSPDRGIPRVDFGFGTTAIRRHGSVVSPTSPSTIVSVVSVEEDDNSHLAHRKVLSKEDARVLLSHFESIAEDIFCADLLSTQANPLTGHMLPLAYENSSLLHALLGFAASHISPLEFPEQSTVAIEQKVLSIQALGSLMLKEQCLVLSHVEEDIALSIVLLLLLQDICEIGISSHGAHLNGVVFLCTRMAESIESLTPFRKFLLAALSWFDLLRGMSGAEKLAFPSIVRERVCGSSTFELETLSGCPKFVFKTLGDIIVHGKGFLAGDIGDAEFSGHLKCAEDELRRWEPAQAKLPSPDPAWPQLANAYRHVALLRVMRFPDAFATPCTNTAIRKSVQEILDTSAQVGWNSPYYRRLLYAVFYAGTDTEHSYQHHYVRLCLEQIIQTTGLMQPALLQLLELVWQERARDTYHNNIPWTEYTCSISLRRQHDYLFF